MMAAGNYNPVIYQYLKKYQEDPTSRVFAPLAEAYRKAGLVDEAIDIAREGLRVHPGFVGGRVALARALFDKREYQHVIDELSLIVRDVPDNLIAQKLLAESNLMLGRVPEALGAYKMLLYFSPNDPEAMQMVSELESQAYEKGTLILRTDPKSETPSEFSVHAAAGAIESDPAWKHDQWVLQVEFLQSLLVKVERYRANIAISHN